MYQLQHGPPGKTALASLQLINDYHPANTLHTLAHARVSITDTSLLWFWRTFSTSKSWNFGRSVFLPALTELHLTLTITSSKRGVFKQEDLPNLKLSPLHITGFKPGCHLSCCYCCILSSLVKITTPWACPEWQLLNSFKNSACTLEALESLTVDFASYYPPLPGILSAFDEAAPLKELVLKNWVPSIFTFDGVNLPCLTKIEVKHVCLTACCSYLVDATLPSLKALMIYEYSQGEANLNSFPPSSRFPALHTFHLSKTLVSHEQNLSDRARQFVQLIISFSIAVTQH